MNSRCVVFLLLPQFFSKRGRQALMAYAFILALTGPAKNTLHNIGVLAESLACGQVQKKKYYYQKFSKYLKRRMFAIFYFVVGTIKGGCEDGCRFGSSAILCTARFH